MPLCCLHGSRVRCTNKHVVFRYTAEASHGCKATNRRVQDTGEPRQRLGVLSFEYFCQTVVCEYRHYDLLFTSVPASGNRLSFLYYRRKILHV